MDLQQLTQQTNHQEVIDWINTTLKATASKQEVTLGEAEHIVDYFNSRMEKGRKTKLRKMSFDDAKRLSQEWVESLKKKGLSIVETESDVEEIAELGNGLRLVKLIGENAFKREGNLMSHCVSSYYGKETNVYSIRDDKNMPHCTIEVSGDEANQVKGKGNGEIHPKYISAVLEALKVLGKGVRKSEMTYLGYRELDPEIFKVYRDTFKDFKYISYQGSVFMYNRQSFKRTA